MMNHLTNNILFTLNLTLLKFILIIKIYILLLSHIILFLFFSLYFPFSRSLKKLINYNPSPFILRHSAYIKLQHKSCYHDNTHSQEMASCQNLVVLAFNQQEKNFSTFKPVHTSANIHRTISFLLVPRV